VFPFDQAKLAGYRALVAVRLTRPADALAAFAESLPAGQPAPRQRAVVMLEVATAARQDGAARHDTGRIDEAFRLAGEALAMGVTYSSERVIERARRFRRGYTGPDNSYVREFDEQLRSASQYRAGLPAEAHPEYDRLLSLALAVRELPFTESTAESHLAASKLMIDTADELYAVWDSQPARSGQTAHSATDTNWAWLDLGLRLSPPPRMRRRRVRGKGAGRPLPLGAIERPGRTGERARRCSRSARPLR
jgi:hypothetical protein